MSELLPIDQIHDLEPVFLGYNRDMLEQSNYPYIYLGWFGIHNWPHIHDWCISIFGKNRYTWAGDKFWFITDDHLLLFANVWMLDSLENDIEPW